MLQALAQRYNFSFSSRSLVGDPFNSVVKTRYEEDLTSGKADLAIGDFFQTLAGSRLVDTLPYTRGCIKIAAPRMKRLTMFLSLLTMFDKACWGLFLAVGTATVVVYAYVRYKESRCQLHGVRIKTRSSERLDLMDLFAQFLGSMMRKTDYKDEQLLLRAFIHAWTMVGFFFASIFFKSILTQKLTTFEYPWPVHSLEELGPRGMTLQDSDVYTALKTALPEVSKPMWTH
jgi:hypothetical protein